MIPYNRAKLVFHNKSNQSDGRIIEIKIWQVPRSKKYPFGIKYSFYCVKEGEIVLGYDNHFPKGPHKHIGKMEIGYDFLSIDKLFEDFKKDLKTLEDENKSN